MIDRYRNQENRKIKYLLTIYLVTSPLIVETVCFFHFYLKWHEIPIIVDPLGVVTRLIIFSAGNGSIIKMLWNKTLSLGWKIILIGYLWVFGVVILSMVAKYALSIDDGIAAGLILVGYFVGFVLVGLIMALLSGSEV